MIDGYSTVASPLSPLLADGLHQALRSELSLFGQFVGTWDMHVRFFGERGHVTYDEPGTWAFGWILDGRAVQDVLICPRNGSLKTGERSIGTSLRYFDPGTRTWSVYWLGSVTGTQIHLTATATTTGILLEGSDVDGSALRWTFGDITADSFHWQGHTYDSDGRWRLEQDMTARRAK